MLVVGREFLAFLLPGRAGGHGQVNPRALAAPGLEEKSWDLLG